MGSIRRARGAAFALALSLATPTQLAIADDRKKPSRRSVAECTSFDQRDRDESDGVDFSVQNNCSAPVACSLSWAVTCAPESRKRRSRKVDRTAFQLESSNGLTVTASTSRCGDEGWSIDDITWSCEPAKD